MPVRVSTRFRLEWRFDVEEPDVKRSQQRRDDRIAKHPQAPLGKFGCDVMIAQKPGSARKSARICRTDFDQHFGTGNHFDHTAVVRCV